MEIRPAREEDVPELEGMFRRYLREALGAEWRGSPGELWKDIAGGHARLLVATNPERAPIGFLAWSPAYDFHHCIRGGSIDDMYVEPSMRGRGVGVLLVAAVARKVRDAGGAFLRGTAVNESAVRRLYARAAVCGETVECTVSGRAFRRMAELDGRHVREVVRSLPRTEWNFEA